MDFLNLVRHSRSYRRFDSTYPIDEQVLRELIDVARLTPSAANIQPLKYVLSCHPETNERIFSTLTWAGALRGWPGVEKEQRPTGYILILVDGNLKESADIEVGIAAQTILLAAGEKGLGGCMFGSIQREKLRALMELPSEMRIALVLALGRPAEQVVLEDAPDGGPVRYYRDEAQVHHVPKRPTRELIHRVYR